MAKSFLLMVDEEKAAMLSRMITGIQFLHVEGMDVEGSQGKYRLIVQPVPLEEQNVVKEESVEKEEFFYTV